MHNQGIVPWEDFSFGFVIESQGIPEVYLGIPYWIEMEGIVFLACVIYNEEEGYFVATVPVCGVCLAQGDNIHQITRNIRRALRGWLDVLRESEPGLWKKFLENGGLAPLKIGAFVLPARIMRDSFMPMVTKLLFSHESI